MEFKKEYWFLSNFAISKFIDPDTGIVYPTVEHFYQAHKTTNELERSRIVASQTPAISKYLGRRCTLRVDWNEIKIPIMEYALKLKFTQDEGLKRKLIATGDLELIEGNTWGDTFWGLCNGKGRNELGKLLMRLRSKLINE